MNKNLKRLLCVIPLVAILGMGASNVAILSETVYASPSDNPGNNMIDPSKNSSNPGGANGDLSKAESAAKDMKKEEEEKNKGEAKKDSDEDKKDDSKDNDKSGNYGELRVPIKISTAYHDALEAAKAEGDKDEKMDMLDKNTQKIIGGHWSNVGALYGPFGLSKNSATDSVADTASASRDWLKGKMKGDPKNDAGDAYYQFGRGLTSLTSQAKSTDPSTMSGTRVLDGISAIPMTIAKFGVDLLKKFNPAPVVLAFWDAGELNNPKYATENGKNFFVDVVNSGEGGGVAKSIIETIGGPSPIAGATNAQLLLVAWMTFAFGFSVLSVFMNGRQLGMTLRKNLIRVTVAAVGIQIASALFVKGLDILDDVVSATAGAGENRIVKDNLYLDAWAKSARFGLPQGTKVAVDKNGKMVLTPGAIEKINYYSAYRAGVISEGEYANGNPDKKAIDKIAAAMTSASSTDRNTTSVAWRDNIAEGDSKGNPWKTDKLNAIANSLGSGEELDKDPKDVGYLSYAGLDYTKSGGDLTYTYSQNNNIRYGLTPIAAYNILSTQFDGEGLAVSSNLQAKAIPSVAVSASTYSGGGTSNTMNSLVSGVLNIVMLFAGFKALAQIFAAGFGAMLKGGATSVFGSAAGVGTLIGGIVTLVGGIVGLSIIIALTNSVLNMVWETLHNLLNPIVKGLPVMSDMSDMADKVRGIWIIGGLLAKIFDAIIDMILTLVALIVMPKLVKVPIQAFGQWISQLPSYISSKAQSMEDRFTGDYRHGGGMQGGQMAANGRQAAAATKARAGAVGKGAALMAGAAIGKSIFNNSSSQNASHDEKDVSKDSVVEGGDSDTQVTDETLANHDAQTLTESSQDSQLLQEAAAGDDGEHDEESVTPNGGSGDPAHPEGNPDATPPSETPAEAVGDAPAAASDSADAPSSDDALGTQDAKDEGTDAKGDTVNPGAKLDAKTIAGNNINKGQTINNAGKNGDATSVDQSNLSEQSVDASTNAENSGVDARSAVDAISNMSAQNADTTQTTESNSQQSVAAKTENSTSKTSTQNTDASSTSANTNATDASVHAKAGKLVSGLKFTAKEAVGANGNQFSADRVMAAGALNVASGITGVGMNTANAATARALGGTRGTTPGQSADAPRPNPSGVQNPGPAPIPGEQKMWDTEKKPAPKGVSASPQQPNPKPVKKVKIKTFKTAPRNGKK